MKCALLLRRSFSQCLNDFLKAGGFIGRIFPRRWQERGGISILPNDMGNGVAHLLKIIRSKLVKEWKRAMKTLQVVLKIYAALAAASFACAKRLLKLVFHPIRE